MEICSSSGLLATDKCPAEFVYRELATKEQMPTDPCNVHGDARTRIVRDLPDAGVPRAALAVDTNQVQAVAVKGPTLLAESDPYNAVHSTVKPPPPEEEAKPAIPVEKAEAVAPENDPTILRAEPVEPGEQASPPEDEGEEVLRAEPVEPSGRPQNISAPIFSSPTPADPGRQ